MLLKLVPSSNLQPLVLLPISKVAFLYAFQLLSKQLLALASYQLHRCQQTIRCKPLEIPITHLGH